MNSLDRFSKNTHIPNFIKKRPVGAELFHADGRTDIWQKSIVASRILRTPLKKHQLRSSYHSMDYRVNKLHYQPTVQNTSLIHIYRRILQHVSSISYSHLHGTLIYKGYLWSWNLTSSAVNGEIGCNILLYITYNIYRV